MVMPLYDDNPFKLPHRPIVTWGLIVANLVLFVAEFGASAGPETVVRTYGLIPTPSSARSALRARCRRC